MHTFFMKAEETGLDDQKNETQFDPETSKHFARAWNQGWPSVDPAMAQNRTHEFIWDVKDAIPHSLDAVKLSTAVL